jgi:hypothetical protein
MLQLLVLFILVVFVVEAVQAMFRRAWHFSILDLLMVTFSVAVVMAVLSVIIRNPNTAP